MNDEIINNLSSFVFNSNDKIKMSFYSFEEMLLYENDYPIIKNMKDIKEDFLNNCSEENKLKIPDLSKDYNNNNFSFYSKD